MPVDAVELPVPPFDSEPNINSGTHSFDQGSWRYSILYGNRPGSNIGLNLLDYQAHFIPEQERLEVDNTLTTDHDNDVYFLASGTNNYSDVTVESFTVNTLPESVCVTPGQPYRWTVARGDHITVRAGRHGDGYCAERWNERVGGDNNTFGHNADELNFYVSGTLGLSFTRNSVDTNNDDPNATAPTIYYYDNIFLAQGHTGSANNWWFGGTNCSRLGQSNTVTCSGADSSGNSKNFDFFRGGGADRVNDVDVGPTSSN